MELGCDLGVGCTESSSQQEKTSFFCPCGIVKHPKLYLGDGFISNNQGVLALKAAGTVVAIPGKHFTNLNLDCIHKIKS